MKAEHCLSDDSLLPDQKVIEVWYDGKIVATVTGADGPGVRVISSHPLWGLLTCKIQPNVYEVQTILEG